MNEVSDDVAPLTPTQQLLYCFERAAPGTAAYRVEHAFRVRGPLDTSLLQRALDQVAHRHDSLRAEFSDDVPPHAERYRFLGIVQRYVDAVSVPLTVSRGAPQDESAWLESMLEVPIALDRAPLMKVFMHQVSNEQGLLVLLAHHCVWDGWSAGVFLDELGQAMAALASGEVWAPEPAPSYAAYARRRHDELTPAWLRERLSWWKDRFDGAPSVIALPRDRDYPARQSYEAGTLWFAVPADCGRALLQLGRGLRATPFVLLSAAFAVFLRRHAGPDIVWGSAFGNRDGDGLERAVGDFSTALPLRADLSADLPFRKVLSRVRTAVLETLPYQSTPFHKLVPALQGRSQSQRHPLFQVLLQYDREGPGHVFPLGPLLAEELPVRSLACTLDLGVRMWETPDGESFAGRIEYRRDLFDPATVTALVAEFLAVLQAIARQPDATLSEILGIRIA